MSRDVVVVGGGVIGAFCAWELAQRGDRVTIVDQGRIGGACSHGNCGYVSPSHILPLPRSGAVGPAVRALMQRNGPLRIRLGWSPERWRWFFEFWRRCNDKAAHQAGAARHGLLVSSRDLYEEFAASCGEDFQWTRDGLWFIFESQRHFDEFAETNELLAREYDESAEPYAGDQLEEMEPALKPGLGGGWLYRQDRHLRPDLLMQVLRNRLLQQGVQLRENTSVDRLEYRGDLAAAVCAAGERIPADDVVIAAGALTPTLQQWIGCRIPIQPGKGYSITMARPEQCPKFPMIFEEHRVAVTPFQDGFRIGSTMEFAGYDATIRPERLQLLRDGARRYLRDYQDTEVQETWCGWRPMTWDGKPVIDRSPKHRNLWIAAGHNMLGLSMGPATGRLLAELMHEQTPHLDPAPFSATRF